MDKKGYGQETLGMILCCDRRTAGRRWPIQGTGTERGKGVDCALPNEARAPVTKQRGECVERVGT